MKKAIKYTAIGLLCVLISAVILEIIMERLYGIQNNTGVRRAIPIRENQPLLTVTASKDEYYNGIYGVKDVFEGLGAYYARVDANGFIEPSKIYEVSDRTLLFLGGSTTECITVAEEKRYPYLVGRILEENTGYKVNSYNAGIGGGTSHNSLDTLLHKGLVLDPDIAVLHHNINDLIMLLKYEDYCYTKTGESYDFYWMQTAGTNTLGSGFASRIKNAVIQIFPAIGGRIAAIAASDALPADDSLEKEPIVYDREKLMSTFQKNLEMFISICQINNIVPVLMTQANRMNEQPDDLIALLYDACGGYELSVEYEEFWKLYEEMNDVIRQTAERHNILCIDLEASIEKTPENFYDMVHYTDDGSVRAADVIAKELQNILEE